MKITREWVVSQLKPRARDSHKYDHGMLEIRADAKYPGAAILNVGGALCSGCGLVSLNAPDSVWTPVAVRHPECLFGNANRRTAILNRSFPRSDTDVPSVLDADALHPSVRGCVITPHPGEYGRITNKEPEIFSQENDLVIVLKGHITRVYCPDGKVLVNEDAGNPGLAKAGAGDVLSGVIGSLLAQGYPREIAAAAGVWIHAAAADMAAEEWGYYGLPIADLPKYIAKLLKLMNF